MNDIFSTLSVERDAISPNRTLNLDTLRSFVAICETGSFRGAASRVNRSPSAISLQIAKLEDTLGAKVLTRDARHVRLTEQGETLLSFAHRLLGLSDEAMAAFTKSPYAGHLKLVAPHDLGVSLVPDVLRRLADTHPGIVVDVHLGTSGSVQDRFTSGTANLALFNEVDEPAIAAQRLFSEPLVWLMKTGGRAAQLEPLPLAIAELQCSWRDAAVKALHARKLDYRIAYSSDTSMGQVAALRADLAIAALPRSLINHELIEVPPDHNLPKLSKTHVYLADDGSELSKVFASMVTTMFDGAD